MADTGAVFDDSTIRHLFEDSLKPVRPAEFTLIWYYSPDQTVCQETVEPVAA